MNEEIVRAKFKKVLCDTCKLKGKRTIDDKEYDYCEKHNHILLNKEAGKND